MEFRQSMGTFVVKLSAVCCAETRCICSNSSWRTGFLEIYILRQAHVWRVVNIGLQLGSLQPPAPATQLAMEPQGGEFVQNHWITLMSTSTHRIFTLIHGIGLMADSFSSLVSISFGFSMETYFRKGAHFCALQSLLEFLQVFSGGGGSH